MSRKLRLQLALTRQAHIRSASEIAWTLFWLVHCATMVSWGYLFALIERRYEILLFTPKGWEALGIACGLTVAGLTLFRLAHSLRRWQENARALLASSQSSQRAWSIFCAAMRGRANVA